MDFYGMVTKRISKISYEDWLNYTKWFLRTFDSVYEGTSNIEIKTDVFIPVGWQRFRASEGDVTYESLCNNTGDVVLKLQDVKLNGNLDEALAEAIPESLFRKINSIRVSIDPNDEAEKSAYAFGQSNFTKKRARHIDYYAQGSERLTEKIRREFIPKSLREQMLYKVAEGIERHLDVFG